MLEPVLTYRLELPEGCDPHAALRQLRELEEEDPQLHILWDERLREIHIQLMGEVQLEILRQVIAQRFGMEVSFGAGSIVYRETIAAPVEGWATLSPYATTPRSTCCWSPGSGQRPAGRDRLLHRPAGPELAAVDPHPPAGA